MNELEILEEVGGLPSEDLEALRRECQTNLFFLAKAVLGYKDVTLGAHGQFCKWIVEAPKKRRLGLMPRGHLKTTIGSIADSVRLAIEDPDNTRVLIASESATLAEKILSEIKGPFEKNDLLRSLFPEVVPPRFSGPGTQWSATQASVVRTVSHKDATWSAIGVGGAIVGGHFTRIKCDDLIGFESLRSKAAMDLVRDWVDYMQPLLVDHHTDIIDFYGTRWSKDDLYAHIIKSYGRELSVFTRRAMEEGPDGQKHIIFPEKMTQERFDNIKLTNPHQWYSQYENDPLSASDADFPSHLVRYFHREGDYVVSEEPPFKRWPIAVLDRVLVADPNSGSLTAPDTAAISVQGQSPDREVFQLESWSGRPSPTDFVDKIYAEARRWNVRSVCIEKAGQQNTDHYFKLKIQAEGWYVRVEEAKPKGRKKEDRIRFNLEPVIRLGQLFIQRHQTALYKQLVEFPDTDPIDELDAAAYGIEFLRRPDAQDEATLRDREALMKKLMRRRNLVTGY